MRGKNNGKVIKTFEVEFIASSDVPSLQSDLNNPYSGLSDEERVNDLVETFSLLWAESCQEKIKEDN